MIKDFFYLQKNDQQAILVLVGVVIVCISLVLFIGNIDEKETEAEGETTNSPIGITKSNALKNPSQQEPLYYKVEGKIHELFAFDPNTADSTALLRLGLQPWQVRSIYRYRAKGGIYRTATDFARLFGLTKKQYETLAPYIHIADDYRPASDFYGKKSTFSKIPLPSKQEENKDKDTDTNREKTFSYPHKLKPGQYISINTADTTELMKIPGIGSYYAKRIVRYRELLGGFTSSQQLLDIEGITESVQTYIHIDASQVKKLNVNKLNLNQLRKHPYINFYQAKAICDYRRLRGPIKDLEDLKLLNNFPPAEIERLRPYVCF